MLEVVYDWQSLYALHTVAKFGLIAPLRQASHFPVFCWLSTSLKYLAQSMHILVSPLRWTCPSSAGQLLGFFFRPAWHAHFGSPHVTEMVVGNHCISWLLPLENVRVGPMSPATALDGPTHRHGESGVGLLHPADSGVG